MHAPHISLRHTLWHYQYHTLRQYRISHSTIRYASTARTLRTTDRSPRSHFSVRIVPCNAALNARYQPQYAKNSPKNGCALRNGVSGFRKGTVASTEIVPGQIAVTHEPDQAQHCRHKQQH
eukprot:2448744-Rhodomonas_salina.1